MLLRIYLSYLCFFLVMYSPALQAQPSRQMVEVEVSPQQKKFDYSLGEQVDFNVTVKVSGIPVRSVVTYSIEEDMMEPLKQDSLMLPDGTGRIKGGTMKKSGFLRCKVGAVYDHCRYEGLCTVGFEPEKLVPTVIMPTDFNAFWDSSWQRQLVYL